LQVSRSLLAFFSAETVRLILLRRFGHLSHSCIKTRHDSVFLAYIFKHSERNDLIFFGLFKNVSVYDAKKRSHLFHPFVLFLFLSAATTFLFVTKRFCQKRGRLEEDKPFHEISEKKSFAP